MVVGYGALKGINKVGIIFKTANNASAVLIYFDSMNFLLLPTPFNLYLYNNYGSLLYPCLF